MDRTTVDNIIDYINRNYIYELDILGGEPLCDEAIDTTLYLLHRAVNTGCIQKIYVSSNGFYPHNIEKLIKCFDSKIALSISIQFGVLETYNSKKVKESISFLESSGTEYVISTVVDNSTIQNADVISHYLGSLEYCKSLLLHYPNIFKSNDRFAEHTPSINQFWAFRSDISFMTHIPVSYDMPYAYHINNGKNATNQFESIFCSCSGEYRKFEVMPDGTVVPCALLSGENQYIIGSINDKKFIYKPTLPHTQHTCRNQDCKFNCSCKVCHAYINDWGEDVRCPSYLNV